MKAKKQRVGSFLCFGAPVTADERPPMKNEKKENRRTMSSLVKSISFKSSKSSKKIAKEQSRLLSRKTSDSLETTQSSSTGESFGKNSDAAIFSSSSLSSSSNSSCSCSSSSCSSCLSCAAAAAAAAAAIVPESKLHRRRTFVPPLSSRNNGYAIGLFLVLLSLFVVVFCGRLCAIVWTATWLSLVPRRMVGGRAPEQAAVPAEMRRRRNCREKEEEKKRVVLEGFLQRNRKAAVN